MRRCPLCAHSNGANVLLKASIIAGYQSRREQVVPELATAKCQVPQLDVEGWSTWGVSRLLIDFSIRHPGAAHYSVGQDATVVAGRATKRIITVPCLPLTFKRVTPCQLPYVSIRQYLY